MHLLFQLLRDVPVIRLKDCEAVSLPPYLGYVDVRAGEAFCVDEITGQTGLSFCLYWVSVSVSLFSLADVGM